jgi:cytochrome oxidase assembly protein ShyY1
VLVARGWLPRDPSDRARLPPVDTPSGTITIEGRIMRRLPRVLQLGQSTPLQPGAIVQNIQVADVAAAAKMPMLPFIVEQTGDADDHLVRDWPRPSSGIERHRGYAVQWYGLALAAFLFFIVTGFRRERK